MWRSYSPTKSPDSQISYKSQNIIIEPNVFGDKFVKVHKKKKTEDIKK